MLPCDTAKGISAMTHIRGSPLRSEVDGQCRNCRHGIECRFKEGNIHGRQELMVLDMGTTTMRNAISLHGGCIRLGHSFVVIPCRCQPCAVHRGGVGERSGELRCDSAAIADGRMAASCMDVMASMAACGLRELGDEPSEVDEDREIIIKYTRSSKECYLRAKRQVGTRGAHGRYRSHQAW